MQCVQASTHQGNKSFFGAGKQCMTNSFSSMLYALEKPPTQWETADPDEILKTGDEIYRKLGAEGHLLISDIPTSIDGNVVQVQRTFTGTIGRNISEGPFFTLSDSLQAIEKFTFLTIGCYSVAILHHEKIYHVFDSHSRNDCGMPVPEGTAVLISHKDINDLCLYFKHLAALLFENASMQVFETTHIAIANLTQPPLSPNSTEFSGFSEMTDGEYSCRMFLIEEERIRKIQEIVDLSENCSSDDIPLSVLKKRIKDFSNSESNNVELDSQFIFPMCNASPRPTSDLEQNFESDKENLEQNAVISYPTLSPQDAEKMIDKAVVEMETSVTFLNSIDLQLLQKSFSASDTDELVSEQSVEQLNLEIETTPSEQCEETEKCQSKRKARKRTRCENNWTRNIAKRLKNLGEKYINKHGQERKPKVMRKACSFACKFKCSQKFDEDYRENLFHSFWKMGDITKQRQFLIRFTAKMCKKRPTLTEYNSNRLCSFKYNLPGKQEPSRHERVCKLFFLNTLGISQQMIYTAHSKVCLPGVVGRDDRGSSSKSHTNRISEIILDKVREHIKSFPTVESHYCRRDSQKSYLNPGLSLTKMYSLYNEFCDSNNISKVKIHIYRKVFNEEFNISFHRPRKDQCDVCVSFQNMGDTEKDKTMPDFQTHIKNKTLSRESKDADKILGKTEADLVVACFDLEEVLITPKSFESSVYYKRRLNTYNFTIYNLGNNEGHCYMWNETIAGRGASEIASCVYHYMQYQVHKGKKQFIFYSDNCAAQNKNKYYLSMLWFALQKLKIRSISHKYLEKGHTFNENDSVHAAIETASRHLSVYTTPQWAAIARASRPNKPYIVHELSQKDFFDFKVVAEVLRNFDLDDQRNKVYISGIRQIFLNMDEPNDFFFKYNYDDQEYGKVNFLTRVRRNSDSIPEPSSMILKQLRMKLLPIKKEKYDDLISLCKAHIIPYPHHLFFALLPYENE